jgi:hypothetical protein
VSTLVGIVAKTPTGTLLAEPEPGAEHESRQKRHDDRHRRQPLRADVGVGLEGPHDTTPAQRRIATGDDIAGLQLSRRRWARVPPLRHPLGKVAAVRLRHSHPHLARSLQADDSCGMASSVPVMYGDEVN